MLSLVIPEKEFWDERIEQFVTCKETHLQLEHSLIAISKWEAKWHKPFLSDKDKTAEEILDYVKCMTLTKNVDPNVYLRFDDSIVKQITDYINDSMTATTFSNSAVNKSGRGKVVTSEVIYYMMIFYGIPLKCQKWHLNRLLTLINVCKEKSAPKKKMSAKQINERNAALNAQRRKMLGTRG